MVKHSINLNLTPEEKQMLRRKKFRIKDIPDLATDEIEQLLEVPYERAREIHAWVEFQLVPSIGIRFAEDLVFLGYYSLEQLKSEDGHRLFEAFERKKGFWMDACVEDQFLLAVHYANTQDRSKKWWDFTPIRKEYRVEHPYPATRPRAAWYEVLGVSK